MEESSTTSHSMVDQAENVDSQLCDGTDPGKVDASITDNDVNNMNGNATESLLTSPPVQTSSSNTDETMSSENTGATCGDVDTSTTECTGRTTASDTADGTAIVTDTTIVAGTATLADVTTATGTAIVTDTTAVTGTAIVTDAATVTDVITVTDPATVTDVTTITDAATVTDAAIVTDVTTVTEATTVTDAYHYLKRGEYSTENFKLCVKGLRMSNYGRVSEFIVAKLGFKPNKVKIARGHIFIAFKCEEDLQKGLVKLQSAEHKGVALHCERAEARADPFVTAQNENEADSRSNNRKQRKRKGGDRDSANNSKISKDDGNLSTAERLISTVCPLGAIPYADQLLMKEGEFKEFLKKFTTQLKKQFPGVRWIQDVGSASVCCEVLPIIPSPVEQHYRNKTEFTIGLGEEGNAITVGFRIGHYRDGSNLVVQADGNVVHTAPIVCDVAQKFSDYLANQDLPSYDITTHQGFWKQLMVRGTRPGELMVVVQVKKGNISAERFPMVVDGIKQHFSTDDRIASVYISHSSTHNNNIDTYIHVSGLERIQERLHGLTFSISPQAFFQVNTAAAEVLYQTVIDWAKRDISEKSIILDVCCGTGTIGICAAKQCPSARVVGVDSCKEGIEDAQRNLEQNGVVNASFSCGLAEDELARLISQIKKEEKKDPQIIAIVDPPRAGLHPSVIFTLRNTPQINRIIYVSCSPKQAEQNFFNLCALPNSKKRKGAPFKLVRAVPVDLFPHTNHCEAVLEFERLRFDDLTRPSKSHAEQN